MSENGVNKSKKKGISLGRGISPESLIGVAKAVKSLSDFAAAITPPRSQLIQSAIAIQKLMDEMKISAQQYAEWERHQRGFDMYSLPVEGLYGRVTKGLYDVEDVIDALPEEVDDETEIEPAERQLLLNQIENLKNEVGSLRQQLENAGQSPKGVEVLPFKNKTLVFGQTFRNQEFYATQEYSEMIVLWNTLHKDPTFDLPMEVMRGNTDAIRLWELFAKANNLQFSTSEDIRVIRDEVQRTREAMEVLASQENDKTNIPQIDGRRRGNSGRPHLPADRWAWQQVNEQKRPMNQVYQEWLARDDVVARELQDPKRHFNRITKPNWGIK